jgi:hypothetical protein
VTALAVAVIVAMLVSRWSLPVGLPIGLAVYVLLLLAVGGVGRNDLKTLRSLYRGGDAQ